VPPFFGEIVAVPMLLPVPSFISTFTGFSPAAHNMNAPKQPLKAIAIILFIYSPLP
jgi:hypothetical protein